MMSGVLKDGGEKLSFDAAEEGPGFGRTSPLQSNRIYNHMTMQRKMKIFFMRSVRQTFFCYVFANVIR